MSPADDQDWMDALAGRDIAASPTRREAQALRLALRAAAAAASEPAPELARDAVGAARREAALIERAAREGLIAPAPRRRARWQWPMAASVLLVIAAGLVFRQQAQPTGGETVRGDERGVVHLYASDPARLTRDILTQLRAAGVEATGYEALDVHGIDADLPLPLTPAVKAVLDAHAIATPADGVLRIEIRSTQ